MGRDGAPLRALAGQRHAERLVLNVAEHPCNLAALFLAHNVARRPLVFLGHGSAEPLPFRPLPRIPRF